MANPPSEAIDGDREIGGMIVTGQRRADLACRQRLGARPGKPDGLDAEPRVDTLDAQAQHATEMRRIAGGA